MSNHIHLFTSATEVWLLKPEMFILHGLEARPEGRGQATPTTATFSASSTPVLNQVLTGHRKFTRSPQTIPQKPHTSTRPKCTQFFHSLSATPPTQDHFLCGWSNTKPLHTFIAIPLALHVLHTITPL